MNFSSGSNTNTFLCPCCKENTRHIKVSTGEAFSHMGTIAGIVGEVGDLTGLNKISSLIMNLYYWKCVKCANITGRKRDGSLVGIMGEDGILHK